MSTGYEFDRVLDRRGLSTAKWEGEIARTGRQDLLAFGTADMDFKSAPEIIRALQACAARGHFGYPFKGSSYYEAIVGFMARRFDWRIDPAWIIGSTSIYSSLQPILEELTEPGDEIIIQTPVHFVFEELICANGRVPIENPLVSDGRAYRMDFDDLVRKISPRTRAILLCNPHNPIGRLWTRDELLKLHEISSDSRILVISDEVYNGLIFPGEVFTPAASVSSAASMNTITLTSPSKSFNLSGLKHSVVIAENPRLRAAIEQGQKRSNVHFGGSIFGLAAAEAAYSSCDDWLKQLMLYVVRNVEHTKAALNDIYPKAHAYQPQSAYFLWLDLSGYGLDSQTWVRHLEQQAGITVAGGHVLGSGGQGHIRLNLGCPRQTLESGLARLRSAGVPR